MTWPQVIVVGLAVVVRRAMAWARDDERQSMLRKEDDDYDRQRG